MLVRCQREIELLENLLRDPECGSGVVASDEGCLSIPDSEEASQIFVDTKEDFSFQTNGVFVGIGESVDEYDHAIKAIECKLFLKGEVEVQGQQTNIEEGYVLKDLKNVGIEKERSQHIESEYEDVERQVQNEIIIGEFEDDSSKFVVEHQRKEHVRNAFWKMYVAAGKHENIYILILGEEM